MRNSKNWGCGKRGSLRTWCREHWSRNQKAVLQKPGQPSASHKILSPSNILLHLQVLIYGNSCLASLGGTLGQLHELQQLKVLWNHFNIFINRSSGQRLTLFIMAEAGFTKGLENSLLLTGDCSRTRTLEKNHVLKAKFSSL